MRGALAIALLAACSGAADVPEAPKAASGTASLTVVLTGFRSDKGQALVALYAGPRGFPDDVGAAVDGKAAAISGGRATVRFEAVPAGQVAVAAFHDADRDNKLKRGFFGQPTEGYGFSRDARARFGPPDFSDAAVAVGAGEKKTIQIKIRY